MLGDRLWRLSGCTEAHHPLSRAHPLYCCLLQQLQALSAFLLFQRDLRSDPDRKAAPVSRQEALRGPACDELCVFPLILALVPAVDLQLAGGLRTLKWSKATVSGTNMSLLVPASFLLLPPARCWSFQWRTLLLGMVRKAGFGSVCTHKLTSGVTHLIFYGLSLAWGSPKRIGWSVSPRGH